MNKNSGIPVTVLKLVIISRLATQSFIQNSIILESLLTKCTIQI